MSRFFALSRTSHGVLDLAAPAFCALLALGRFPPWSTIALSLFTAFAGYTAIYALNDLLGISCDRQKFAGSAISRGYSVEASPLRHPLAQGILSVRSALIWASAWFVLALIGSYVLNPTIVLILVSAAALEVIYCKLLKVTYLRTLVSGLVKTAGPVASILVVEPHPSAVLLLLVMAWLFFWEIGGQNVPSDWNYSAEDQRANAKTVPIQLGYERAGLIVVGALGLSVIASGLLPLVSPARLGLPYVVLSLLMGYLLLLRPSFRLYEFKEAGLAARLFDRASYYPLSQFGVICAFLMADVLLGV
jgi:4-hydroxybenzoate polyprenyltransferase